jgi:hypothetical protein
MTANIFGSSSMKSVASGVTKKYVDSKFITLTTNLQSKIDKNKDLDMGGYSIHNVKDPVNDTDVVNKKTVMNYINQLINGYTIKNSVGLIPSLNNNNSKMGYIVRASSEREPNNLAFCAFNNNKSGWCVADGISENFWIEITCPEPVLIHKCSIKGLYGRIYDWKLQGNIGDAFHTWTDLYPSLNDDVYIDKSSLLTFDVFPPVKYSKYRIYVNAAEAPNPGISHWQLYSVDTLSVHLIKVEIRPEIGAEIIL